MVKQDGMVRSSLAPVQNHSKAATLFGNGKVRAWKLFLYRDLLSLNTSIDL